MAKHCQELTKEMRESDAELEQVLALGEDMRGELEQMKRTLVDKDEECTELLRIKNALKEELEESSATLSQVSDLNITGLTMTTSCSLMKHFYNYFIYSRLKAN